MWNLNSTNLLLDIVRALEQQSLEIEALRHELQEQRRMITKLYSLYDFLKHLLLAYWKHSLIIGFLCSVLAYIWHNS